MRMIKHTQLPDECLCNFKGTQTQKSCVFLHIFKLLYFIVANINMCLKSAFF